MAATVPYRSTTITRDEFIELRSQVNAIVHSVEQLSNLVVTGRKEWELQYQGSLARVEAEIKAQINTISTTTESRFNKNEQIAETKQKSDTEGRRWLLGTMAALFYLVINFGNSWSNSIKEAILLEVRNEITPIKEQNATSIADRKSIHDLVDINTKNFSVLEATIAAMKSGYDAKLIEIETQFRSDGQFRNIQWSEIMRRLGDYQNALHSLDAKVPEAPSGPWFQPNVGGMGDSK